MATLLRDRFRTLLVLSLFSYMVVSIVPLYAAVAVGATDLNQQIAVVAKRPAEVAKLTHEVVSADVKHAAQTARVVTEVTPPLAAVVTAAAVHAAPHRAADIVQAVANAVPMQAKKIQVAADIAATLSANPAASDTIIGAKFVVQPERAITIVTAAVTVCSVLEACPQSTVEDLVQAAVTADRGAVETIVGAAVRLMPANASAIIAAASDALAPATVPPVRSAASRESASPQPAPQLAQSTTANSSSVPDLTKTDPVQRARVVPNRTNQSDAAEAAPTEPLTRQAQSVPQDQEALRELERVEALPKRVEDDDDDDDDPPPRRPRRRPNPASGYQR